MASTSLPPETERLWKFLSEQPALAGFVLVGGTALALRIRHRASEDLDFACTANKLPRRQLEALITLCRNHGHKVVHRDNPAADDEFANAGMELRDYQQDYLVNDSVRISFFAADGPLTNILSGRSHLNSGPRVAEVDELFRAKAIVSAARSKTRDWFDLWILMREHGFSMRQFRDAFLTHGAKTLYDTAMNRICSGKPETGDEGYRQLIAGDAPSVEEMRDFFRAQRDALEIELAVEAKREAAS